MKTKTLPILVAITIPLTAIIISLAFVYINKAGISSEENFSYRAYMSAPQNFAGNRYSIKAQVESQLAQIEGKGRVLSVRDYEGNPRFAIFLSDELEQNVRTNQRYLFDVVIGSGGEIIVKSMRKF